LCGVRGQNILNLTGGGGLMCQIISNQHKEDYTSTTRAVRIMGHATSVRLENYFWRILDAVAVTEGVKTPQLLNRLYEEACEANTAEVMNFSSLLRVGCLKYCKHNVQLRF